METALEVIKATVCRSFSKRQTYGISMGFLWDFYGISMGFSRYILGKPMKKPRVFQIIGMRKKRIYRDDSGVIQGYHSMVMNDDMI